MIITITQEKKSAKIRNSQDVGGLSGDVVVGGRMR